MTAPLSASPVDFRKMESAPVRIAVAAATSRVAPLWPLGRFVAVNPFVGLAGMTFADATDLVRRTTGSPLALPPAFYRERFAAGDITRPDLVNAAREASAALGRELPEPAIETLMAAVEADSWPQPDRPMIPVPAAIFDIAHGSRWSGFFTEEISKWCAAFYDEGQALWAFPWKGLPLFPAWRQAALLDRNPEAASLPGWRSFVAGLGDDPLVEIERGLREFGIVPAAAPDFLHRLLMSVCGWAGHLKFRAHEKGLRGEADDSVVHLLALRMVCERALHARLWEPTLESVWRSQLDAALAEPAAPPVLQAAFIWQRAHECARQRQLFLQLAGAGAASRPARPEFQAVFCIDVRSEIFRRSLESVAPGCQTIGFAGFFGFPIEAVPAGESRGAPQCPVLLTPVVQVPAAASAETVEKIAAHKRSATAWGAFKAAAVSSFVFVETAGLGFAAKFARDLAHRSKVPGCSSCGVDVSGIPLERQIALAAGALRHMGFARGDLARLVVLCGHGSETVNNPFGSSLDCGACGGHSGEANARTAVAILNHPAVRAGLREQGIDLPEDAWFVAALHNTTTDEVEIFDPGAVPSTHREEFGRLERHFSEAGTLARQERAPLLGESPGSASLDAKVADRSHDWSQVRPEWGLAGNFAFIAAPRARTQSLRLAGRVFLHDYRYEIDQDEATLELLLSAPVVVASWINLQYFASTVDNDRFGAGNKVLHNVAGALGVFEGNGGDLRVGLPFQSVHDGAEWRHEPLRLAVCVEAPKEAMDRVLARHPEVAALVANEWIHLFALDGNGCVTGKSDGHGGWKSANV